MKNTKKTSKSLLRIHLYFWENWSFHGLWSSNVSAANKMHVYLYLFIHLSNAYHIKVSCRSVKPHTTTPNKGNYYEILSHLPLWFCNEFLQCEFLKLSQSHCQLCTSCHSSSVDKQRNFFRVGYTEASCDLYDSNCCHATSSGVSNHM